MAWNLDKLQSGAAVQSADVPGLISEIDVVGGFEIGIEPAGGAQYTALASWKSVAYGPSINPGCKPGPPGCGKPSFETSAFQEVSIAYDFEGAALLDGQCSVTVDPHTVPLKLGALLRQLLEGEIVAPLTGGAGSPAEAQTVEDLLGLLLGGAGCLPSGACCTKLAQTLSNTGSVGSVDVKGACEELISLSAAALLASFDALDAGAGSQMTFGTAEACTCVDDDGDVFVDEWGTPEAPCKLAVTVSTPGGDGQQVGVLRALR